MHRTRRKAAAILAGLFMVSAAPAAHAMGAGVVHDVFPHLRLCEEAAEQYRDEAPVADVNCDKRPDGFHLVVEYIE